MSSRLSELYREYNHIVNSPSDFICFEYNVDEKQEAIDAVLFDIKMEEERLAILEEEYEDDIEREEIEQERRIHCHRLGLYY